ncbi:hypothetical protein JCM10908_000913 [Rhodotorula pacifica]|uniref:uncharacterized protein n=1 Tax=Rhodotorula pacifica TaxID=1495444 RepID=UPI00316B1C85
MHRPLGLESRFPKEVIDMILFQLVGDVNQPYATAEEQQELDPLLSLVDGASLEYIGRNVKHLTLTSQVKATLTALEQKAETIPLNFRNLCLEVESATLASETVTATYWTYALYAPPLPRLTHLTCVLSFGLSRFLTRLKDAPSLRSLNVTIRRSERLYQRHLSEAYHSSLPQLKLHELRLVTVLDEWNAIGFRMLVSQLSPMIDPTSLTTVDIAYNGEHTAVAALLARCRYLQSLALRPTASVEREHSMRKFVAEQAAEWPLLERLELDSHPQEVQWPPDVPLSNLPIDLAEWISHLPPSVSRLDLGYVLNSTDELLFRRLFDDPAHPRLVDIGAYELAPTSTRNAESLPVRRRWHRSSE